MYWSEFVGVLFRRWYVLVPSLIVTLALAYGVVSTVPKTYRASASVVLLPATVDSSHQATANRYAALPVTTVSALLVDALGGYDVSERLLQLGLPGKFHVTAQNAGYAFVLDAEDSNAVVVTRRLLALIDLANEKLLAWQFPSTPPAAITAAPIHYSGPPRALHDGQSRRLAAVLASGTVLSLMLVFLAENEAHRRRRGLGGDAYKSDRERLVGQTDSEKGATLQRIYT